MTRILLFLSVLFFSNLTNAQNCTVPQVLVDYYDNDVKDLALKRMKDLNAPELSQIEIDQTYQDTIMQGLAAIYNSNNCQKEQIFNEYCIHHRNKYYANNELYIQIDTTASWYDNWKNGVITTEIDEIDSLFSKYGINEVVFSMYTNTFNLVSTHNLNLSPLINILKSKPEFSIVEQIPYIGSGNQILYEKINNTQYYTFILAWGDCPAGCTIFHIWKYAVNENCDVTFLEESGSPIPFSGTNCNISGTYIPATISASNNNFCIGDSSILTVDRGEQFLWSTGETSQNITVNDAGNYFVTITESNGCVKYANINISMATPSINFQKLSDTICYSNNPIDLIAYPDGGQFMINQDAVSGSFIPSQLDFGLNTVSYSILDTVTGCTNTVTQNIVIHRDTTKIYGKKSFCKGESTLLYVSPFVRNYLWSNNSTNSSIEVKQPGLYSVTVMNNEGCIQYAEANIIMDPLPNVSFTSDMYNFYLHDDKVKLSGGTPLGGVYNGDGVIENNFIPYAAGLGIHEISYEVTDTNTTCTAHEYHMVTVLDDFIKYDISQEGNQWNIADFHNQDTSIIRIRVKGDTLFKNLAYRKLEINHSGSLEWESMDKYIRQDSSKRVFIRSKEDSGEIFYDYNLQLHDPFKENVPSSQSISVDKIDYVADLNGKMRRQIHLKVIENDRFYNEIWLEGIGSMKHLTHAISEENNYALMCFYQNGELIYQRNPQGLCIFDPTTDTKNIINANAISVVPNPVSKYFQLDGIDNYSTKAILLYNIDGKLLKTYKINQKYDISDLQNGIYFINIITNDQKITKKMVVER